LKKEKKSKDRLIDKVVKRYEKWDTSHATAADTKGMGQTSRKNRACYIQGDLNLLEQRHLWMGRRL